MKNYISGIVSYIAPGERSGSKVRITFPRFKKSRTFAFDYSFRSTVEQMADELAKAGVEVAGCTELSGDKCALLVEFPDEFTGSPIARFLRIV